MMQRSSWTGGRFQADAEDARSRPGSYSKAPRGKQGFGRDVRIAGQQKRLTARVLGLLAALACLALIFWGLAVQLELYGSSNPLSLKTVEDQRAAFEAQVTELIERTERERQKALADLQPAFRTWQELKAAASEARARLKESRADLRSAEELHSQRLNILPAAKEKQETGIGDQKEATARLTDKWQTEVQSAERKLDQVSQQDKDVMYRESRARHLVESLRQKVQALGSALAEYVEQKNSPMVRPLRGARQPGNVFDLLLLLDVFSRNLDGLSRKRSLMDQQIEEHAASVLQTLEHPLTLASIPSDSAVRSELPLATPHDDSADRIEQDAIAHSIGANFLGSGGKKANVTGSGFEAVPAANAEAIQSVKEHRRAESTKMAAAPVSGAAQANGDQATTAGSSGFKAKPHLGSAGTDAGELTGGHLEARGERESVGKLTKTLGASRAMLPDAVAAAPQGPPQLQWLSERWADRSSGVIGANDIDGSLRCESSGICEGITACKPGLVDNLGCISQNSKRQEVVQEAARWSWEAYRKFAFGKDELLPLSQTYSTWFNLGLTLVDSLDTLLLLGLDAEYEEARRWVAEELQLDPDVSVNLFETTIRVLGGLLAAFHISNGDKVMLYKAASLALRLLPAFSTNTGIPFSDINLRTHSAEQPKWTTYSSLSEVTSLSLEFGFLARATGDKEGAEKALHALRAVLKMPGRFHGLAPMYVDIDHGNLQGHILTLGARGDSYYEYLLKQWLASGKKDEDLLRGYEEAMRGLRKHMLARTDQDGLLFVAELTRELKSGKMDHLVCFLPGLLALGHHHGVNTAAAGEPDDLEVAEDVMRTCYEMYRRTPTGLAPELAFFKSSETSGGAPAVENDKPGGGDFVIKRADSHNLLRPETMESLFVLWRVTGKAQYQEWAWMIFRAFQVHTRCSSGGYANLDSVLQVPAPMRDKMESFWLAETLKYLYLLLDDSNPSLVSLDEYVFNTEAHPLPVEGSMADIAAGHAYEADPYRGISSNMTLDNRIQFWEDLAKLESGRAHTSLRRTSI